MNKDIAISIINEARSNGHEVTIPDYEPEIIRVARELVKEAQDAYKKGSRGELVETIIHMAEEIPGQLSFDTIVPPQEEKFPIPKMRSGEPPDMPNDLTEISDKQLRSLHGRFAAWESRLTWLQSQEETNEFQAKQVAEFEYMKAHSAVDRMNHDTGKALTAVEIDIEAKLNDKVIEWREKQNEHTLKIKKLKALRELCKTAADRISREGTLRQDERNLHH